MTSLGFNRVKLSPAASDSGPGPRPAPADPGRGGGGGQAHRRRVGSPDTLRLSDSADRDRRRRPGARGPRRRMTSHGTYYYDTDSEADS